MKYMEQITVSRKPITITSRIVTVTPQVAQEWLETKNIANNRHIAIKKAHSYAKAMFNDEWMIGDALKFDMEGMLCEFALLNQHFTGGNNAIVNKIRHIKTLPDFNILSNEEKQHRLEDTQEDIFKAKELLNQYLALLYKLNEVLEGVENQLFCTNNVKVIDI